MFPLHHILITSRGAHEKLRMPVKRENKRNPLN